MFFKSQDDDIKKMMRYLDMENFEFFFRQRLLFDMNSEITGMNHKQYSLNEIFVAEEVVS